MQDAAPSIVVVVLVVILTGFTGTLNNYKLTNCMFCLDKSCG